MAKLLISFPQRAGLQEDADPSQPPDQRNSTPYRVTFNEEVLEEIKQNFAGVSEVFSVLSLRNTQPGRDKLEVFLCEGNEGSFSSNNKPPGVYVWTRPVPLNSMSLLLVKMWGVDFLNEEDEELDLITKKVMIALMSISSMCLFSGNNPSIFPSLTVIYELYTPIKERFNLEVSKFLVFVEKEAILKHPRISRQRDIFNNRGFENPPVILYQGIQEISPECKESLLQIVGNLQNHQAYLSSHRRVKEAIKTSDMINSLAIILTTILDISTIYLDFQNFIEEIPSFTCPNYRTEIQLLEETEEISRSVLSETTLEFFDKITIASTSYKIKNSLLTTLQTKYEPDRPIIVMVIIGNSGMGSSTMLNHIVKRNLGCPKLPELFKTGNSPTRTTKASQVLSSPLRLGENQLMLLDLEGLQDWDIVNEREAILQENLISAILTIASVPCILVRNELRSINLVDRISSKLSILKRKFGYKLERVHLLFYDKDLSADTNVYIECHIQQMNRQYFEGEEVLKLRNKPNFCDESKAEMRVKFLRELMADSHFPKRGWSGSPVLLKQLLVEMKYITEQNSTEVSEIRLTDREIQECNHFLSQKSPLLREIFENVKGNETNGSLESNFSEQCRQFMAQCDEELEQLRVNWFLRATSTLEDEAASYRAEIVGIEYCYQSISNLSENALFEWLEEQLDFLYQESRWVGSFNENTAEFKKKLLNAKDRYPSSVPKMDQILSKYEEKRNSLEKWFIANYGLLAVTTVATLGLGLAAKGAMTAGNASRLGLNKPAIELFTINKPRLLRFIKTSTTLNTDAIRILEEGNPSPVTVLLVIAAKELGASFLLNEFIQRVAPFTRSSIVAFNSSKCTQILYFNYKDRRVCIINLRMKKNETKDKYKIIDKIAISLIPKVSLTCLFLDSPSKYADDIITNAFPAKREAYNQIFSPRVAAIYPGNKEDLAFLAKFSELERRGVHYARIRVRDFSNKSLKCAIPDVKNEFNISTPIDSRALLEALRDAERTANC